MPRYIPIKGDDLVLVEQEVKTQKIVTKKGPVNHIWIIDRSGSMTGLLPGLCSQLIDLSKKVPKNDILSLGWFSGEGDFNWIFKGFKITEKSDYKVLESAIKQNSSSRNTTCFSEILADTAVVIKDLSVFSKTFSLSFFSDGYPVVSSYEKELKNISLAIKAIKGKIQSSSLIGFGSYYNKTLMSSMSEELGAMLIHSSEIKEYSSHILKLVDMSQNNEPKIEVPCLVQNPLALFTITPNGIVNLAVEENAVFVAPQKESIILYYVSQSKPDKKSWDKVEPSTINFGDASDRLGQAIYGAALVMSQKIKTDLALDFLGKIGDMAFIDGLSNAFLTEEYGEVEQKINQAIYDVSQRFISGRKENHVPATDAFCIFDALTTLTNDEQAAFYPYKVEYQRTGVASSVKDGYSKFSPDKESKCFFNTMVMHESRLNLNIQTKVNGLIELQPIEGKNAGDLGFSTPYPVFVFRNFTFVKDGHLHTKKAVVSTSEETYKLFKNKGIINQDDFKAKGEYTIDLSTLPVINRKMSEGKLSGTELAKMVLEEQQIKAKVKALKWLRDQELPETGAMTPSTLSEQQNQFLIANGVKMDRGGMYDPKTEKEEAVDWYQASTFEIKLSGIASLPTVKKVQEKIASAKNRTPVETLIEAGVILWEKAKGTLKTASNKKIWFDKEIKALQEELKTLRAKIQSQKMVILLAKKWFQEFDSRQDCSLVVDGITCQFVLSEEKVGY